MRVRGALALAFLLALGGCGGGGTDDTPGEEAAAEHESPATAGSYLNLVAPSVIRKGESVPLRIRVVTQAGLPDYDFEGAFRIDATSMDVQFPPNSTMEPQKEGHFEMGGVTFGETGVQRLRGSVPGDTIQALANPIVVQDDPEYRIYWGDLNGHSDLSSGMRAPGLYFWYAKAVALLDFVALTDNDRLEDGEKSLDDATLLEVLEVANEHDDPGRFVALLGLEWSSREYGNRLVYFGDSPSAVPSVAAGFDTPAKLAAAIPSGSVVAIPHPSGSVRNPPADPTHAGTGGEALVEIYSSVGAFDSEGSHRASSRETTGAFVSDLLRRGFRPGFIATSDSKLTTPGNWTGVTSEDQHWPAGLTAVLAKELTREAVLGALRERRCYATTGPRFLLEFTVDGRQMGSELRVPKGHRAEVYASLGSTTQWVRAEIVGPAGPIALLSPTGGDSDVIELTVTTDPVEEPTFVYFRGVDELGDIAWASPVYLIPE